MADLFLLRGPLNRSKHQGGGFSRSLRRKETFQTRRLSELADQIDHLLRYYEANALPGLDKLLVSVEYLDIVPKSRRISRLFYVKGKGQLENMVVGARYGEGTLGICHIITYSLGRERLIAASSFLRAIAAALKDQRDIGDDEVQSLISKKDYPFRETPYGCFETALLLIDCSNISKIGYPVADFEIKGNMMVSFYKIDQNPVQLLKALGIDISPSAYLESDEYSLLLDENTIQEIKERAPYLISMGGHIWSSDLLGGEEKEIEAAPLDDFGSPNGAEPWIGVFDIGFDKKNVLYENDWVEVEDVRPSFLKDGFSDTVDDYVHGTAVTSLIVAGPELNKGRGMDDGCGRFRVRHFVVGNKGFIEVRNLIKQIRKAVKEHPEIHVWNLSSGTVSPVEKNSISYVASVLDELQKDYPNILFVVSGTNDKDETMNMRLGSPADSINSLVVNSVGWNGASSPYSRKGPVLSFFRKPDLCYYGGEGSDSWNMLSCDSQIIHLDGTSFASPWIARKASYLIDKAGFSRNAAKALLINSCVRFTRQPLNPDYYGYGVVPVNIKDVLEGDSDEIRFVIEESTSTYYTSSFNLPVPMEKDRFPFKARAVLSFTSECNRNQGVDYTCEELALSFGRMDKNNKIRPINNDLQEEAEAFITEGEARALYRKWDNVKVIGEILKQGKPRPLSSLSHGNLWGFVLSAKQRFRDVQIRRKVPFAIVVTLKEMYGQDRSEEFSELCARNGWIVKRVNVEMINNLIATVSNDIVFE